MKRILIGLGIIIVCIAADILSAIAMVVHLFLKNDKRFWKIAVAKDQGFNAAFLNGSEDETVSSHAARARNEGRKWGCILCKFLDAVEENHCDKSIGQ